MGKHKKKDKTKLTGLLDNEGQMLSPHKPDPKVKWEQLKIYVTLEALLDMTAIIRGCKEEIGWLGAVERMSDTDFVIHKIFLFKQEVAATTTEIDGSAVAEWASSLDLTDPANLEIVNNINFWGHSHVKMQVGPSGQDDIQAKEFIDDYDCEYLIRGIGNKLGDLKFDVFFKTVPRTTYLDVDWEVWWDDDLDGWEDNWQEEIKEKVSKITYSNSFHNSNTHGRSNGSSRGTVHHGSGSVIPHSTIGREENSGGTPGTRPRSSSDDARPAVDMTPTEWEDWKSRTGYNSATPDTETLRKETEEERQDTRSRGVIKNADIESCLGSVPMYPTGRLYVEDEAEYRELFEVLKEEGLVGATTEEKE